MLLLYIPFFLFNAVYHFTDLPSFVSGEHLVMFDPHTKYVPGATHVQPGIKVRASVPMHSNPVHTPVTRKKIEFITGCVLHVHSVFFVRGVYISSDLVGCVLRRVFFFCPPRGVLRASAEELLFIVSAF